MINISTIFLRTSHHTYIVTVTSQIFFFSEHVWNEAEN